MRAELLGEGREICFECDHIKIWHDQWFCKQPSCQCKCFIESGVFRGMSLFEAYEKGKEDTQKDIQNSVKKLRDFNTSLKNEKFIDWELLDNKIVEIFGEQETTHNNTQEKKE